MIDLETLSPVDSWFVDGPYPFYHCLRRAIRKGGVQKKDYFYFVVGSPCTVWKPLWGTFTGQ